MVLKPAVREVIAWKKEANTLFEELIPIIEALPSVIRNTIAEPIININVVDNITFVCNECFRHLKPLLIISFQTIKPIPPTTIKIIITTLTKTSPANGASDEYGPKTPIKSNPALQKAEIEWKTEYHIPGQKPKYGQKRIANKIIPPSSNINVPINILLTSFIIPPIFKELKEFVRNVLSLRPILFFKAKENKTANVINPNPPICISIKMTI